HRPAARRYPAAGEPRPPVTAAPATAPFHVRLLQRPRPGTEPGRGMSAIVRRRGSRPSARFGASSHAVLFVVTPSCGRTSERSAVRAAPPAVWSTPQTVTGYVWSLEGHRPTQVTLAFSDDGRPSSALRRAKAPMAAGAKTRYELVGNPSREERSM